jgi:hypothetical protein
VGSSGRLLAAVLVLAGAAGCASVPTAGPVRVVRRVPAGAPELPEPRFVRHVPPGPPVNAAPEAVVRGYLAAQADAQNDHGIARKYLAPDTTWNPGARVTVYTPPSRVGAPAVKGGTATVVASLARLGTISAQGEFRPPPSAAPAPVTFRLRKVAGVGWRIASPPAGVLLSRDDVGATFARTTLYWTDQARRLVPDLVFLPVTDQPVATVTRALLDGPKGWLAPAVRSAFPPGTRLLDPPTVVDGVATLNFSREIRAPQETLGTLLAQLVWTLTELPLGVRAVRVDAEGDPLAVPGRAGLRDQRRTDWTAYAPAPAATDTRLFYVKDGGAYAVDESGRSSRVGGSNPALESVAVNRTGTVLAAVTRRDGGKQSLRLVDLTGSAVPRTALVADRISAPTWEAGGDVVWVATTTGGAEQVYAVPTSSAAAPVPVPAPVPGPVAALRLSPDGARALLVVGGGGGGGGGGALWSARIERPASGGRVLGDPRLLAPSVGGVTAAAFDGTTQVLFAATADGPPVLFHVDLDGYDLVAVRADGLPAGAVGALTVSAGPDTLVDRVASAAGQLWRRTPGTTWAPLQGRGSAATYAG